jgi:hypothetical protein
MAVLSADGTITTIGEFNEDNGILYSNYSWKPRTWTYGSWGACGGETKWYEPSMWDGAEPRKLMNVCDIPGAYVTLPSGDQVDTDYDDSFAIDAGLHVYEYDGYLDVWIRTDGAIAYTPNGRVLQFNGKSATWEDTMDEDTAILLYEELGDDEGENGEPLPDRPPFALT